MEPEFFSRRALDIRTALNLLAPVWNQIPDLLLVTAFTMRGVVLPDWVLSETDGVSNYERYEYLGDKELHRIIDCLMVEYLSDTRTPISEITHDNIYNQLKSNMFLYYLAQERDLISLIIKPKEMEVIPWKAGADVIEAVLGLLATILPNRVEKWFIGTFDIRKYFGKLARGRELELPINARYGPWGPWSSCSTTCGVGVITRSRKCNNPSREFGGLPCSEPNTEQKEARDWSDCPARQRSPELIGPLGLRSIKLGSVSVEASDADYGIFHRASLSPIGRFADPDHLYQAIENAAYQYDLPRMRQLLELPLIDLAPIPPVCKRAKMAWGSSPRSEAAVSTNSASPVCECDGCSITSRRAGSSEWVLDEDQRLRYAVIGAARGSNSKLVGIIVSSYASDPEIVLGWLLPTGNLLLIRQLIQQLYQAHSAVEWLEYLDSERFQQSLLSIGLTDRQALFEYIGRAVPDLKTVYYSIGYHNNVPALLTLRSKQTAEYVLSALEGGVENYSIEIIEHLLMEMPDPDAVEDIYRRLIEKPMPVLVDDDAPGNVRSMLEFYLDRCVEST